MATALGSRDGTYEVHGAFHTRPARARLCDRNLARERSTSDMSRPCGRRECRWRVLYGFGTDGSTCEHMCGTPRAARRVFCSRSESPGRYAQAGLHGKPRRFSMRVTSTGTSRHERRSRDAQIGSWGRHGGPHGFIRVQVTSSARRELRVSGARWLAWRTPQKRALIAMRRATTRPQVSSDRRDERASRRPPPWRCKKKTKKGPRSKYTMPQPGCGKHPAPGQRSIS